MSFNISTFIFQIIAFLILYWILSKYAFGPLFGIMEKRKAHIQDQLETAEQNRKSAEQMLAEQKEALHKAGQEAHEILEEARLTSSKKAEEMLKQAREEADRIKADALSEIENEKNKAVAALRSQVSAMSIMIASKIVEKQVDEASQEQLIQHYLNEVGENQ